MADTPSSTIYLLKRAELAVRGCVEVALGAVDLTPSQYFILFLVNCGEATSSAEIVRRPDPGNNRILRIELTAAGKKLFAKGTDAAIRIEKELLDGLDARDLAAANRLLGALTTKAERHSFHPKLRRLAKVGANPKAAGARPKTAGTAKTRLRRRGRKS
jgi:hypothetical protein